MKITIMKGDDRDVNKHTSVGGRGGNGEAEEEVNNKDKRKEKKKVDKNRNVNKGEIKRSGGEEEGKERN